MDNSITVNKYIQQILEENEEVKAILGNEQSKIFPLLQPDNLSFPFIVHMRQSLNVTYTKDMVRGIGWVNTITYAVSCVSNDYIQCIELANAVRHALETYRWKDENICMDPIMLQNVSEYTVDDTTFVEELTFTITVK